jgi:hypothetical protein
MGENAFLLFIIIICIIYSNVVFRLTLVGKIHFILQNIFKNVEMERGVQYLKYNSS